jgi:Pyruvate/2-oxoacid:ferredoxin oxidoreductase gamma subunit
VENVIDALRQLVPAKHVETNVKAFQLGYGAVKKEKVG